MAESPGPGAEVGAPPPPEHERPGLVLDAPAGERPGHPLPHQQSPGPIRRTPTRAIVVGGMVVLAVWLLVGTVLAPTTDNPAASGPVPTPGAASWSPGAPADSADLAAATAPALVDIEVTEAYQAVQGAGTGMVLTADGLVLTNNHVVEGGTAIRVRDVGNGRTYGATVLGYDRSGDVAVLRLSGASGLRAVADGTSARLAVGDGVVAVGNAGGTGGTPSHAGGMITGLGRAIAARDELSGTTEELAGLIETNQAIVPGYSGGALVDTAARVVGMVTAASQDYEFSHGAAQGYAIPFATARQVAAAVVAGRRSATVHVGPTAFLGVRLTGTADGTSGAVVVDVVAGSPAAVAGIQPGDTITALDGTAVASAESVTEALVQRAPGSVVRVGYADAAGRIHTTAVTLDSGPPQ